MTGSLADRIVREIEQAAGLYHRLLELIARLRVLRLPDLLREIAGGASGGIVLLDNIEILFDAGRQRVLIEFSGRRPQDYEPMSSEDFQLIAPAAA